MVNKSPKLSGEPRKIAALSEQAEELRKLILGDENIAFLEGMRDQFGDEEKRVEGIARDLPPAILGRVSGNREEYLQLVDALKTPVEDSLGASVETNKKRVGAILAPVFGGMFSRYLSAYTQQLLETINERLVSITTPSWWASILGAKIRGESASATVGELAHDCELEELLATDPSSNDIIAYAGKGISIDGISSSPGPAFQQLLDPLGEAAATGNPMEGAVRQLADGRLGMISCGVNCHVLGIAAAGASPGHADLIQLACDEIDTLLTPEDRFSTPLPADDHQRALAGEILEDTLKRAKGPGRDLTSHTRFAKVFCLAILTAVILAVGLTLWGKVRWTRMIAKVEAQPGITVVGHHQSLGGHRLHLIADPLAKPAREIIGEAGFSPDKLAIHADLWQSADPSFASRHAPGLQSLGERLEQQGATLDAAVASLRSEFASQLQTKLATLQETQRDQDLRTILLALDLPPTLDLARQGNRVKAAGRVSEQERETLQRALGALPWPTETDLSKLDTHEAAARALTAEIEGVLVRFHDASLLLREDGTEHIATLARLLKAVADTTGQPPLFDLVGLTLRGTATGVNAQIATERCHFISGQLRARGIPPEWLGNVMLRDGTGSPERKHGVFLQARPPGEQQESPRGK